MFPWEGKLLIYNNILLSLVQHYLFNPTRTRFSAGVMLCIILLTWVIHSAFAVGNDSIETQILQPPLAEGLDESPESEITPSYVALKNNLLYDATLTPNLQLEFRLDGHWTLQAGVGFNPFPLRDEVIPKWRHLSAELAPRYWFCEAFARDFVSLNIAYAHYNVAGGKYPIGWLYKDVLTNRLQGDAVMLGASYGWTWNVARHFNIELEGGIEGGLAWYDRYECVHCGKLKAAREHRWFALPRLGVNIVWLLNDNEQAFDERCDCMKLHGAEVEEADSIEAPADTTEMPVETIPAQPLPEPTEKITPEPADTLPVMLREIDMFQKPMQIRYDIRDDEDD